MLGQTRHAYQVIQRVPIHLSRSVQSQDWSPTLHMLSCIMFMHDKGRVLWWKLCGSGIIAELARHRSVRGLLFMWNGVLGLPAERNPAVVRPIQSLRTALASRNKRKEHQRKDFWSDFR